MRRNMSGNLGLYKYLWPGSVSPSEEINGGKFKKYVKKQWILKEKYLSVFETANKTNNSSETYHKNFKSRIKTHRPNMWSFFERYYPTLT